jgi:hypothetical protein
MPRGFIGILASFCFGAIVAGALFSDTSINELATEGEDLDSGWQVTSLAGHEIPPDDVESAQTPVPGRDSLPDEPECSALAGVITTFPEPLRESRLVESVRHSTGTKAGLATLDSSCRRQVREHFLRVSSDMQGADDIGVTASNIRRHAPPQIAYVFAEFVIPHVV